MPRLLKFVSIVAILAATGLAVFLWLPKDKSTQQPVTPAPVQQETAKDSFTFGNSKKSAHYESNTPVHGSVLAGVPINVVIDFNFDLAKPSSISIISDRQEYARGETIIDENKLSMRRTMDPQAPDGLYTVRYNACWPDKSCHDGMFQFAIRRELASTFRDMTAQKAVTIRMKDVEFSPVNIRISKGTAVTWINEDSVTHYVNTDSHPAHTYLPGMNSRSLAPSATHSFIFNETGFYPYHCSAHAGTMVGAILVE